MPSVELRQCLGLNVKQYVLLSGQVHRHHIAPNRVELITLAIKIPHIQSVQRVYACYNKKL